MKMTEREEGYEIDNTVGAKQSKFPVVVLGLLLVSLVIWRFVL